MNAQFTVSFEKISDESLASYLIGFQKNDVKDDPKISKQNGITDNRLETEIEKQQGMFNKDQEK